MSRLRILGVTMVAALVASAGLTGVLATAVGARPTAHAAKDDKGTGKGDGKGKGEGKPKDDGKRKDNGAGGATPATPRQPTTPAPPAAPVQGGAPAAATPGLSATPAIAVDAPSLVPTLAQSVGVATAQGIVRFRTDDDRAVHALDAAAAIPTGAHVDARAGSVELSTALDATGATQTATFSGAIFEVRQAPGAKGLTQIVLAGGDFSGCRATPARRGRAARAVTAAEKRHGKPIRSLWGKDDHGRFQTRGRGAVGTVRGTRWLTQDFCDGTLTRVVQGSVAVRDLARHATVVVRAGHSYFAAR